MKTAIAIVADPKSKTEEAKGRLFNALALARECKQHGDEVEVASYAWRSRSLGHHSDAWLHDQALLDQPGSALIQLAWLHDYQNNFPVYGEWQEFFRQHQPPTLITWGA